MSIAYHELHAGQDTELRATHVEILRELDLRELTPRPDDRCGVEAVSFRELCVLLRRSAGHVSALMTELEGLGLARVVRARGRHRQAFRITAAGTTALHAHYERVIARASASSDHRTRQAMRWLLERT